MKHIQVTDNVVLYRIPQGSNIICIALDNELVFIDTGLNTVVASNFRKEMEKKFGRKLNIDALVDNQTLKHLATEIE